MWCIICSMSISLGGGNIPIRIRNIIVQIAIETAVSVIVGVTTKRTTNPCFSRWGSENQRFSLDRFQRSIPFPSLGKPRSTPAFSRKGGGNSPSRRRNNSGQIAIETAESVMVGATTKQ